MLHRFVPAPTVDVIECGSLQQRKAGIVLQARHIDGGGSRRIAQLVRVVVGLQNAVDAEARLPRVAAGDAAVAPASLVALEGDLDVVLGGALGTKLREDGRGLVQRGDLTHKRRRVQNVRLRHVVDRGQSRRIFCSAVRIIVRELRQTGDHDLHVGVDGAIGRQAGKAHVTPEPATGDRCEVGSSVARACLERVAPHGARLVQLHLDADVRADGALGRDDGEHRRRGVQGAEGHDLAGRELLAIGDLWVDVVVLRIAPDVVLGLGIKAGHRHRARRGAAGAVELVVLEDLIDAGLRKAGAHRHTPNHACLVQGQCDAQ
mmetsp:Transcript_82875/g.198882  ORF Transcript_82875/g.198882 Transcript_82875/m.198882 type:complete len:318 (-) Transcript_82875:260-1213(-)